MGWRNRPHLLRHRHPRANVPSWLPNIALVQIDENPPLGDALREDFDAGVLTYAKAALLSTLPKYGGMGPLRFCTSFASGFT